MPSLRKNEEITDFYLAGLAGGLAQSTLARNYQRPLSAHSGLPRIIGNGQAEALCHFVRATEPSIGYWV